MNECKPTSAAEEIANSLTHGLGLALSIVGLAVMVVLASLYGTVWHIVGCSVFGTTLVALYASSTLYHSCRCPIRKRVYRLADHSCIYLLVAGTYTPITLTHLRGAWGWTLFGIVWGCAVAGLFFKWFVRYRFRFLSVAIYLVMGWLAVIAAEPMLRLVPTGCLLWLLVGGLFYSFGVIFYLLDRIPYFHAIWHLFVLAGSASHYLAVVLYVLPIPG